MPQDHDSNSNTALQCAGIDFPSLTAADINNYAGYAYGVTPLHNPESMLDSRAVLADATYAMAHAIHKLYYTDGLTSFTGDQLKV